MSYPPPPKFPLSATLPVPERSLITQLYSDGFMEGYFSDITIHIRQDIYYLHKIVLARTKYFRERIPNWQQTQEIITIEIDDLMITSEAIAIVFGYIYGKEDFQMKNILAVLIAAQYFQLETMSAKIIQYINENINYSQLLIYAEFLQQNDYRKINDALEDQCLQFLCANGVSTPPVLFNRIPWTWSEKVLAADAFWAPDEYKRYQYVKDVVGLRSKQVKGAKHDALFRDAIIYSHMKFVELNKIIKDGLVNSDHIVRAHWHRTEIQTHILCTTGDSEYDMTEPVRFGLIFMNHELFRTETPQWYGGSWWQVSIQKSSSEEASESWQLSIMRTVDEKAFDSTNSLETYVDTRDAVICSVQIFLPRISHEPTINLDSHTFGIDQQYILSNPALEAEINRILEFGLRTESLGSMGSASELNDLNSCIRMVVVLRVK